MDLQFGAYRLKRRERSLEGPGGRVSLSARSFDILQALLDRPNELVSKDELFEAVWPGLAVEENTLQVHMSALRKALGPSLIVTVHGRGYKYAGPAPVTDHAVPVRLEAVPDRKPLIAVLPLADLGGDVDQRFFSDGITEDIIDRLSRYRILSVIGSHSSSYFRGRDLDLEEVRSRLLADYVLTGSLRNAGRRIRVSVRLMETHSSNVVWAEHYDRPLEDVFAVQDDVAARIASSLHGHVEVDMVRRRPAAQQDISSYEHVLRGTAHFKALTEEGNAAAIRSFRDALAINPENAEAYRWLAYCKANDWLTWNRREHLEEGVALARRAVAIDPASARAHSSLAFLQLWAEGLEAAEANLAIARALNPGDPNVMVEMGLLHAYQHKCEPAHACFALAETLNPLPPLWYAEFRSILHFAEGKYREALPGFAAIPECVFDTMYVVSCLGHLGDAASIARVLPRVKARNWDLLSVAAGEPFANPEPRARLAQGISLALELAKEIP